MISVDLYSPYEGEIEIVFTERDVSDQVIFEVDLWYADFTSLMGYIPIVLDTHIDSVLYSWQKGVGFLSEGNWECKRVQEFYNQLIAINNIPETAGLDNVLNALIQICQLVLRNGNKLIIEYV